MPYHLPHRKSQSIWGTSCLSFQINWHMTDGQTLSASQERTTTHHEVVLHLSELVLWVRQRRLMRLLIGSEQVNYRKLHWQTAKLIRRAGKETALAITAHEDRNNISRRGCLCEDTSFALTDAPQMSPDAHLFVFMVTGGWHLSIFHEPTSACNKQINFPAVDYRAKTISAHGTCFGRPQLTVKKLWVRLFMVTGRTLQSQPLYTQHLTPDWLICRMQLVASEIYHWKTSECSISPMETLQHAYFTNHKHANDQVVIDRFIYFK